MPPPPAAIAILKPLSVEDLRDLVTALTSIMVGMDIVLDLREFSRSNLITMIWIIASAGPAVHICGEIGRRRLPDAEALEKLARLAVIYGGGAK